MGTIKLFTRSLEPKIPEQATTSENQAHYCTLLSQVHLTHFLHQKENALGNRLNLPPGRTQPSLLESHLLTACAQLTIHKQLLVRHNQPQNVNKIHTVMAETRKHSRGERAQQTDPKNQYVHIHAASKAAQLQKQSNNQVITMVSAALTATLNSIKTPTDNQSNITSITILK